MRDIIGVIKSFVEQRATCVLTSTGMPRVDILRVSAPTQLAPEIYQPLVSLILQGEKRLVIGSQVLRYTAGHTFISSVDVPVIGEIVQASATLPYLAVRLTFDRSVVADLLRDAQGLAEIPETRSFCVSPASEDLLDAWLRMLRLMERHDEIAFMAPLLEREILFRLLRSPQAAVLRQVASIDSRFSKIRKALDWIKANYATALRVADLADLANMSSCLSIGASRQARACLRCSTRSISGFMKPVAGSLRNVVMLPASPWRLAMKACRNSPANTRGCLVRHLPAM